MSLGPGARLGPYEIVSAIGAGGMGEVYRARDVRLDRDVALKILPQALTDSPLALERFEREARSASSLNHPNICTIHDVGVASLTGGTQVRFLVMELLEGETLQRRIAHGALDPSAVIDLGIALADALDAAHAKGIIHRDIKPANIVLTARGPKVLDFGLAKPVVVTGAGWSDQVTVPTAPTTEPGSAVGTVAYMSPEQLRGDAVDPRSDLFSLGAVLYEMTTGTLPFRGGTSAEMFDAILNRAPVPAVRLNPDVPPELERIITKALEKDRNVRYQHAADIRVDLARAKRDCGAAQTTADSGTRLATLRLGTWGAIAVVVVASVAATWYARSKSSTGDAPAAAVTPTPAIQTLAVLPLRDISPAPTDQSWGIGITDAIITRLASLQNLAVRPTSSVLKYAASPADPEQAGRDLGVDSILEGTYQRSAGIIRVSVQLIDPEKQSTRWAQHYDLQTSDLLKFQDEVAQKVVDGLRVHVSGSEQQSLAATATQSPEAYSLYLQALYFKNEYFMYTRPGSLDNAAKTAAQAIERDPAFADAHAVLADAFAMKAANLISNGAQNIVEAERIARRAVALDPKSVRALLSLGNTLTEGGKNSEAIARLTEAVRVAPNLDTGWDYLGYAYHYAGLDELAERSYRRSLELNPTTTRIHWMHARMLLFVGREAEAEQEMRQALASNPNQFKAMGFLGEFLYYQGRLDEAEQVLLQAQRLGRNSGDNSPDVMAAFVYASRGQRDRIQPSLLTSRPAEIIDGDYAYWLGSIHALLGERDAALVWLDRAVDLGNHNYPWFQRDRNYNSLRGDPQYQRIMERVRGYWELYKQLPVPPGLIA
jgi:eukaryotic-like serine/threonine-protein kinase